MVFRERTFSVLFVCASEKFAAATLPLLPMTDFYPVTQVKSAGQARRALLDREYDLVIINSPLPDEFGSHLAVDVCASGPTGALLFVRSESYDEVYDHVMESGVMVLSKPTSTQLVSQTLRNMCAVRERLRGMERRRDSVEDKIAEIRTVNRAKWLLIENLSVSEAEAHRMIEKKAMDERVTSLEIAESIIRKFGGNG